MMLSALPMMSVNAATEQQIEDAIEAGLVWLVAQQNTVPADPNFGSWMGYGSREAGTGLALYKLCDRAYELGYDSPFDSAYEYSENVMDGFNWTFAHLAVVDINTQDHTTGATGTIDDPDTNGNGKGVRVSTSYEIYCTGILLAAISASGTPGRVVDVSGSPVDGWTYGQAAQDMVDFLAFAQVEYPVPGITKEGGWDYYAVNNGVGGTNWKGDQSNSGYAVLGLAERAHVARSFQVRIADDAFLYLYFHIQFGFELLIDLVFNDLLGSAQGLHLLSLHAHHLLALGVGLGGFYLRSGLGCQYPRQHSLFFG